MTPPLVYLPPVELIPTDQLRIGMRFERLEYCQKCKRDTTKTFILRGLSPRYWVYQCHLCSNPPMTEETV